MLVHVYREVPAMKVFVYNQSVQAFVPYWELWQKTEYL